jgi:hypothetical protein
MCRNRRRHNNCSNLRQRRREDNANDQISCERLIAARAKGFCTEEEIFTLPRCTTDELFFSCCGSVAACFNHANTRQPAVPQAQAIC